MRLCEDLGVDPDEDCVLYAIAYELGSPRMGEWNKKGWTEGWKNLGYVLANGCYGDINPLTLPEDVILYPQ